MSFQYRVATLEDVDVIVSLVNRAYRADEGKASWTSDAHLVEGERAHPEMIKKMIMTPHQVMLLTIDATSILACIHVDVRDSQAYLGTLAVDPDKQTSGIGRALGIYAEEYATLHMGATHFVTLVLAPRQDLIDFTLNNGYQRTGRVFKFPAKQGFGEPVVEDLSMLEMRRRSLYLPKRPLKILFSPHPEREPSLQYVFSKTPHSIHFEPLTAENIVEADLVVPLTIEAMLEANCYQEQLRNNPIKITKDSVVRLCDDKLLLNNYLIDKGFGAFIPNMVDVKFPYVLKRRQDQWGSHSYVVDNAEQEQQYAAYLKDPAYFKQALVPGNEQFAVHIIMERDQIVNSTCVKYFYESHSPIQGKDVLVKSEMYSCPYLVLFATMLREIGFEGLCCIDYKVYEQRPFLLEINPRMGGSLAMYFHRFIEQVV